MIYINVPVSDDEDEHGSTNEDFANIVRPVSHTPSEVPCYEIEPFPLASAGAPILDSIHGLSGFESYQWAIGNNNSYAPFRSKLDWDIAKWAKLRGPSSSAVTELLEIEGVRQ